MKSIFNKNVIIALVVDLGLGLLYWGIEFLKGANLFEPANYYITKFDNVNGLNVSSPVTVNGYQVGLIKDEINKVIGSYTLNEINTMGTEAIQQRILEGLQEMYNSKFITGVSFSSWLIS